MLVAELSIIASRESDAGFGTGRNSNDDGGWKTVGKSAGMTL